MDERQSTILSNKVAIIGGIIGIIGTLFAIYSNLQQKELVVKIENQERKETVYVDTIRVLKETIKEIKSDDSQCLLLEEDFKKLKIEYELLKSDCVSKPTIKSFKCKETKLELLSAIGSEGGQFIEFEFLFFNEGPTRNFRFYCNNCGTQMLFAGKEYNRSELEFAGTNNSRRGANATTNEPLKMRVKYYSILKESLRIPSLRLWTDSNGCSYEFKNIEIKWN